MYAFILQAHTRPEKAADFERLFRAYLAPSRTEDGCVQYHMLRDVTDPTLFTFFEVWQSREHLAVHSALPHMREFHQRRMDYLRRDFDIRQVEVMQPAA
ncbi:antibiotic biosynthesis monooxygenase [Pseudomonas sp. ZM23]|uniref:Quinol monooxygenase n=1 Tax=Pseudomonas triclosanedens TaxID=2961893 RepID=A0ABY7A677_9PSED|nr:putative quinol monooxygenase [Pseudomonas triclosanedens]MCP8464935.1 antibiotic biosynthesis monooxygenase [Pseudomonas triclosanedens]MCP8470353.1 antibiotic biosynthesis monooxygenase [Pseudomonas triclosanedens]MCP8476158.1 antibiotic biosynthesis monooxygenase [Pseudomonas triclosanedens]WAI51609.1 putative quinol monooxygenase [Pseudomonas triclosanedens]